MQMEMFESKTIGLTQRSVSQFWIFDNLIFWLRARGVTYFANVSAKTNLSLNQFSLFIRGQGGLVSWIKKMPKIAWHCHFKWTLSQDFDPLFNDNNLFGPLFHMLKSFCIWFRFQGDIRMCKKLSSVYDTAKAKCFYNFSKVFLEFKKPVSQHFQHCFFP